MKIIEPGRQKLLAAKGWFTKRNLITKIIIITLVLGGVWLGYRQFSTPKTASQQLQTTTVEKGTLIVAVTGSGSVTSTSNTPVKTTVGGVVSEIIAGNGTIVQAGDAIATVTLDQKGQKTQTQAWANYLSAKTALDNANVSLLSLQADMFGKWQTFMETAESVEYQNSDGTPKDTRVETAFTIPEREWLAAEAKFKNQQTVIQQAQAALSSSWLTYQESSGTITAPVSGTVQDLALQVGTVLEGATSTNSTTGADTTTPVKVAMINTGGNPTVTINITEIDAPKIKVGNKVTVTFDALPDKTFTGSVTSIDTSGSVSSGVTTYPTIIQLDLPSEEIFTNMSAQASIIVETKDNVLLVPSSAVTTTDGESTVRVQKNGRMQTVTVEKGSSSDTQTEIVSGLSEGDTVVTSTISTGTGTSSGTSPFSTGGRGGFSSGGAVRIMR